MNAIGIYIHIPFCTYQCPFCAFSTVQYSKTLLDDYLNAVKQELHCHPELPTLKGRTLGSIYLGGGTPSLIPPQKLQEVLDVCRNLFNVSDDLEITLEATPESTHPTKILAYRKIGVNRLSVGVQSFSDHELKLLGRKHTAAQTKQAVRHARESGFSNISLDLIYGLPHQSLDQWHQNLEEAILLSPEHVSVYGLTLEEGTLFYNSHEAGCLVFPHEETQAAMYTEACVYLAQNGYAQYEISNFAKPGYESRHNLIYWTDGDYLGLGASAHSHLNGRRLANCFDPQEYVHRIFTEDNAVIETEHLTPEEKVREAIAFGLRRTNGLNLQTIIQHYKIDPPQFFYKKLSDLQAQGLLTFSSDKKLRLTSKGLLVADELAATLMSA